jgi:hypothetical protein
MPITTKVVSSNLALGEAYSIQHLRNKSWKPECVESFNMGMKNTTNNIYKIPHKVKKITRNITNC